MAQQQLWSAANWQWDSRNLVAIARPDGMDKTSGKVTEQGGEASTSSSPTTSGDQPSRSHGKSKGAAVCQVDGCNTDLGSLKEYHNRYKICEFHLKIPCITREGTRQRFCQQCGRFHNIGEFDGDKRSCRARLQRHNARRRKIVAEPAKAVKRPSSGSRQFRESSLTAPSRSNSPASDDVKAAASGSPEAARSYGHAYQQPWPQAEVQSHPDAPQSGCAINTTTALDNAFADFLKQENVQPAMPSTTLPAFTTHGSRPSVMSHQMAMEDLLGDSHSGLQNPTHSSDAMDMQYLSDILSMPTDLAYKAPQQPDFASQTSLQDGSVGMSPIYLMHRQKLLAARQRGYVQGLEQQQQQLQSPLASWCRPPDMGMSSMDMTSMDMDLDEATMHVPMPFELGQQGHHLLPQPDQPSLQTQAASTDSLHQPMPPPVAASTAALAANSACRPTAVVDTARDLLAFNHSQPKYIPEEHFTRMSAKLFNCTPEHLPGDLKQNLVGLLSCGVDHIEGYIAPGCLQLTVDAFVGAQQLEAMQDLSACQATECLLRSRNKALWGADAMLLQWKDDLVLVKDGKVEHVVSREGSRGLLPEIHSMTPVCVSTIDMEAVKITGSNIAGYGQTVLCRSQGAYLPVEVTQVSGSTGASHGQQLMLQLPSGLRRGAVQIEIARGGFISHAVPVLVLESVEAVAEIMQLETMPITGVEVDALLRDMGRVLEYSNSKQAAALGNEAAARGSGIEERSIAGTAKRLLSFACQVGWSAVSELLLPIASAMQATASELVADLEKLADDGLTLLHQAVRSRNANLVSLLLTWGINNGHVWDYSAAGPAGLTVLHLAALLNDGGKVADELTDVFADALTGWDSLKAEDGSTAADLAQKSGAQGINAMIQRKLKGQPSGAQAQQFDFDPDTGEWIDHDDDTDSHTEFQTEDWLPVSGRSDDSAALMVPVMLHNSTWLTPDEAVSRYGLPRHTRAEAADSLLAMSSPSSSGTGDDVRNSEDFAEVLDKGLHWRGKGDGQTNGLYSDKKQLCLENKVLGKKAVPHVFGAQAALLSSAVVAAVGLSALGLRFCFECFNI